MVPFKCWPRPPGFLGEEILGCLGTLLILWDQQVGLRLRANNQHNVIIKIQTGRRGVTSGYREADTERGINSHILSPVYMKNMDLCLVLIHRWTHVEKIRYSWHRLIWWREFNYTDHSQEARSENVKRSSTFHVPVTTSLKQSWKRCGRSP